MLGERAGKKQTPTRRLGRRLETEGGGKTGLLKKRKSQNVFGRKKPRKGVDIKNPYSGSDNADSKKGRTSRKKGRKRITGREIAGRGRGERGGKVLPGSKPNIVERVKAGNEMGFQKKVQRFQRMD